MLLNYGATMRSAAVVGFGSELWFTAMHPTSSELRSLSAICVLHAKDDDTREVFTAALRASGAWVESPVAVRKARAFLGAVVPNVRITDDSMRGEDGYRWRAHVRKMFTAQRGPSLDIACTELAGERHRTLEPELLRRVATDTLNRCSVSAGGRQP